MDRHMASPAALKPSTRLQLADARVGRIERLLRRTPRTHTLYKAVCALLRLALMIQLVAQHVEKLDMLAFVARPDYFYEEGGKPPRPKTFEELTAKHQGTRFETWFRVKTAT